MTSDKARESSSTDLNVGRLRGDDLQFSQVHKVLDGVNTVYFKQSPEVWSKSPDHLLDEATRLLSHVLVEDAVAGLDQQREMTASWTLANIPTKTLMLLTC